MLQIHISLTEHETTYLLFPVKAKLTIFCLCPNVLPIFLFSLKLNTALAYTLHSLYYILLKSQGKDLSEHPLKQEIERIKEYVGKVQEALTDKHPTARIDKPLASKLISSHLEDNARQLKGSTPLPQVGHLTWKNQLDKILKN